MWGDLKVIALADCKLTAPGYERLVSEPGTKRFCCLKELRLIYVFRLWVYLHCTERGRALVKHPAFLCLQPSDMVAVWRMPEVAEHPPWSLQARPRELDLQPEPKLPLQVTFPIPASVSFYERFHKNFRLPVPVWLLYLHKQLNLCVFQKLLCTRRSRTRAISPKLPEKPQETVNNLSLSFLTLPHSLSYLPTGLLRSVGNSTCKPTLAPNVE